MSLMVGHLLARHAPHRLGLTATTCVALCWLAAGNAHAAERSIGERAADPYEVRQLRWKVARVVPLPIPDQGATDYLGPPLAYRDGRFALSVLTPFQGCPKGECVAVLDRNGTLLSTIGARPPGWGDDGNQYGAVPNPTGLAFDAAGNIYESDGGTRSGNSTGQIAQRFSPDGRFLGGFGCPAIQPRCENAPDRIDGAQDIEVGSGGDVFVLDAFTDTDTRGGSGNRRIHAFSPDGSLKYSIGGPGTGNSLWPQPADAPLRLDRDAATDRLTVTVAGRRSWALGTVSGTGTPLGRLRVFGDWRYEDEFTFDDDGGIFFPCGAAVTGRGTVMANTCKSEPFEVSATGRLLGPTVALNRGAQSQAGGESGDAVKPDTNIVRDENGHLWFARDRSLYEIAPCASPRACIGGRRVRATNLRVRPASFGRLRLTGRVRGAAPRSEYTVFVWTGRPSANTLFETGGVTDRNGRISGYLQAAAVRAAAARGATLRVAVHVEPIPGRQFGQVSRLRGRP